MAKGKYSSRKNPDEAPAGASAPDAPAQAPAADAPADPPAVKAPAKAPAKTPTKAPADDEPAQAPVADPPADAPAFEAPVPEAPAKTLVAKTSAKAPAVDASPTTVTEAAPQTPTTPATPVDPARSWQIAFAIAGILALALAVVTAILAMRPAAPAAPPTTVTVTSTVTVAPPTSTATSAAPTTSATPTTPTTPPPPLFLTHYVAVNPTGVKPGAIVIEVHTDYQCPWCQRAEQVYGEALGQLAQSGDVDLRIHLRTLIGDKIIKNDSSERASTAALCADKVGAFWAYHSTVFANQPAEGVGYTDDQLRSTFATQAGITGANLTTFQTCYDTKATATDVTVMEQEGVQAGIASTPTFYVDGQQVSFNLQTTTAIDATTLLSELKNLLGRA